MVSEGYVRELTALLVAIGTGIAWIVHRWDKARRPVNRDTADMARAVEDAPEAATEAVEKALDVVTSSLVDDLERVRADAERDRRAAARDRERYRKDREHDRERLDRQGAEIRRVSGEVEDLRANEGRLIAWVVTLHAGVRNGTIPPLPDVPDWLEILLPPADTDTDT